MGLKRFIKIVINLICGSEEIIRVNFDYVIDSVRNHLPYFVHITCLADFDQSVRRNVSQPLHVSLGKALHAT